MEDKNKNEKQNWKIKKMISKLESESKSDKTERDSRYPPNFKR